MATPTITAAELAAELARVKAELEQAKARTGRSVRFKVSEKKAVSVYGLNARFPVTLYKDQWQTLSDNLPALMSFIADHEGELATK